MRNHKFLTDIRLLLFIYRNKNCTIADIRNNFVINENTLQKKLKKWVNIETIKRKKVLDLRLGGPKFEYEIGRDGLEIIKIIQKELCNDKDL